jgi:hypothetical protein
MQKRKKRALETIDLTGSDDDFTNQDPRPRKVSKNHDMTAVPPRSEASQFRYEEDGGNDLVDEIDQSQDYGDASFASFELYGAVISQTHLLVC